MSSDWPCAAAGRKVLAGLKSNATSLHHPSARNDHGEAAYCSCALLLDFAVISGRLVAGKTKQHVGQAVATSGATKSPTCIRHEAASITANLARVGEVSALAPIIVHISNAQGIPRVSDRDA